MYIREGQRISLGQDNAVKKASIGVLNMVLIGGFAYTIWRFFLKAPKKKKKYTRKYMKPKPIPLPR